MKEEDKPDLSKSGTGAGVQEGLNLGVGGVAKLAMNAAAAISSLKSRKEVKIDEELLSRQLVTFGNEYQKKICSLNVLIYGMRGVGAEVAKNLILANVQSVTIVDNTVAVASDLGGNCFIREADVRLGKTRAEACLPNLRKVNSAVEVNLHSGEIHEAFLGEFNSVVFTDYYSREKLTTWNKVCRGKNIPFIFTGLLGLYGFCFLDFGDEHKITDPNGIAPHQAFISHITNEAKAVVTLFEGPHMNLKKRASGFQDGDMVIITEVEGMDEINKLEPAEIKMLSPFCFEIAIDTTELSPYGFRGKVEQIRSPTIQTFLNLEDSLRLGYGSNSTEFFVLDESKRGREDQLHQILQGIISYWDLQNNTLPEQGKEDEVRQLIDAQNLKYKKTQNPLIVEELDRHLLRLICTYSQCQIAPLTTFWGGLVSAELLKSTGKFIPLPTWLHHHHLELLPYPTSRKQLPPKANTRYDDYVQLFGNDFLSKSLNSKTLLAGAGALGSETLKMFALMGMGCNKRGCVNVADDDRIELSNLNRQILAEREDIGESKAVIASSRAKIINTDINIRPMCAKIDHTSSKLFSDRFWQGIDYVICAVDNLSSRQFIDQQCIWYNKPLLESGTEGEKASCQIIIPQKTQSYVDSNDPTEQSYASCTLKFAPFLPEHCISWATSFFNDTILTGVNEFIAFSKDPMGLLMKKKRLVFASADVKECVEVKQYLINLGRLSRIWRNQKFEDCLRVSRFFFDCAHKFPIESILLTYPAELKDRGGQPFWSGELRAPTIANLNIKDPLHAVWVESCARILAKSFNVTVPEKVDVTSFDFNIIAEDQIHPSLQIQPDFEKTLKLAEQRKPADPVAPFSSQIQDLQMEITALIDLVRDRIPKDQEPIKGIQTDLLPMQYYDLLWAITNVRAHSYRIPESEKSTVKNITGKIIAALPTTTAITVGQIGIELIKLINNMPLGTIRNSFMNIGQNIWVQQETVPPIQNFDKGVVKALPKGFTSWDSITVEGPIRVTQFRDFFLDKFDVLVQSIVTEGVPIYDINQKNAQEQEQLDVQELYELAFQRKVPLDQLYLKFVITVLNRKNEVCLMPVVKYIYAGSQISEDEVILGESASQTLNEMEMNMKPGTYGSPSKQRKLENYLEENVQNFLNQLVVDALYEKPTNFLQFCCDWMQLQSSGNSFNLTNSSIITAEILNDDSHKTLQFDIKFLLEELVFDLITKKPINPMEFSLKWFHSKKKQQRLHLIEEQEELPGKPPLSVNLTGVYVQEFLSYQNEYEEARKDLQEYESQNEGKMAELSVKYEQYGLVCIKFEKIPEAITYIKKSLFALIKTPQKVNSIEAARLYFLLAQLFDKQQQYLEAFRYYKEALWLQEQIFGEDRIENVEIMQKIGLILQRGRKYQCSHFNFAKSYEILKTNFNYECPNVIGSLINLANCLLDLRRSDEAMSNYKRVLRMFERNDSMEPNIENLNFLFNMSIATEQCRFFSESIKIMNEALDLAQNFLPKGHPSLQKVLDRIKTLHNYYPAALE